MKRFKNLREAASTEDLWQALQDVWNNLSAKFLQYFYFLICISSFFIHLCCFNYMQGSFLYDFYGEPMFDTVPSVFGLNRCSNTGKGGLTCSCLGEGFDKHQTGRLRVTISFKHEDPFVESFYMHIQVGKLI